MFDEDVSGSNLYGVVRTFRDGECTTKLVGQECNWAETTAGGTAVHLVRDYSLQAVFDTSKVFRSK